MSNTARLFDRFEAQLNSALKFESLFPSRTQCIVTESVPPRLPGRLILCLVEPHNMSIKPAINAAIAVEFVALHHIFHAIASAPQLRNQQPAFTIEVSDPTSVILEGDYLQAMAFQRITALPIGPEQIVKICAALSTGSQTQYERAIDEMSPVGISLTEMAGVIGSLLVGKSLSTAKDIGRSARTFGNGLSLYMSHEGAEPEPSAQSELIDAIRAIANRFEPETQIEERLTKLVELTF